MDLVKSQFRQLQPPRQTGNEGGVPGDPNLITSLLKGGPRYRPYKHEPLDSSSFRILRLYPAHRFEDDIKCEVQQASLPGNGVMPTPYMALSHVWGTESVSCAVAIGEQHILIRSNLESALRHLRHRERIVSLWIDALCIDQSNTGERNHQVQHMRDIYEAAEETIVFLGDQDGGNTGLSAWNYLERNSPWALNEEGEKDYDLPARIDSSPHFRGDMDDICINVLPREWFNRLWVLQEFVVSKSVSLQCGRRRVPAETLFKLVLFEPRKYDRYGAWVRQRDLFEPIIHMWASRTAFHIARNQEHYLPSWYKDASEGVTTNLLDTILRAKNLVASDPRDKIIGLLGISSGFDWKLNNTVDYNLTMIELSTKFAHDFLRTKQGFRILSYRTDPGIHPLGTLGMSYTCWVDRIKRMNNTPAVGPSNLIRHAILKDSLERERMLMIAKDRIRSLLENGDSGEAKDLGMPSWVTDWQYRHSDTFSKVMPIIESLHSKGTIPFPYQPSDVGDFLVLPQEGSQDILRVQGKVIGVISTSISPCKLSSSEETDLMRYREEIQQSNQTGTVIPEASLLGRWAEILDQNAFLEVNPIGLKENSPHTTVVREPIGRIDLGEWILLQKLLKTVYIQSDMGPSFRSYIDCDTWPPLPGSIEYHMLDYRLNLNSFSFDRDIRNKPSELFGTGTDIFRGRMIGLYRSRTPNDWRGSTSPTLSDESPPLQSTGTSDDSDRSRSPPPGYSDESSPQQSLDISGHEFSDDRTSEDWSEVAMSDYRTNDDWSEVGMSGYDDDDDPDLPGKSRRQSEDRNEEANNEDHTSVLEWTPGSPRGLALLPLDVRFGDLIVYFPGAQVPFVVRPLRNTPMGHPDPTVSTAGLRFAEDIKEHIHCTFVGECWINDFPKIEQEMEKLDCLFHIS